MRFLSVICVVIVMCGVLTISAAFSADPYTNPYLDVILEGNGSGSVNSIPSGPISCTYPPMEGTCTNVLQAGTTLTLRASPSTTSSFSGWGGNCFGCGGRDCPISLDSNTSCTARFGLIPPVMISGAAEYFYLLTAAYDWAQDHSVVLTSEGNLYENLVADKPGTITIQGGYDADYSNQTGDTSLKGTLLLRSGRTVISKMKLSAPPLPPPPPPNPIAIPGHTAVTLAWTPVPTAASYAIYFRPAPGVTKENSSRQQAITGTSKTISPLVNNTPYYFRVAAINSGGEGPLSDERMATPGIAYSWPIVSSSGFFGPNIIILDETEKPDDVGTIISSANGSFRVTVKNSTDHFKIQISAPRMGSGCGVTLPVGRYAMTGLIRTLNAPSDQEIEGEVKVWGVQTSIFWQDKVNIPKSGAAVPIKFEFEVTQQADYQLSIHFGHATPTPVTFEVSNLALRSEQGSTLQPMWPDGAIECRETARRPTPKSWPAVIAWAQATTVSNCPSRESKVYVSSWQLEKVSENGSIEPMPIALATDGVLSGLIGLREPNWNFPDHDNVVVFDNAAMQDGVLVVDLSNSCGKLYHWWSNRWPTEPHTNTRYYLRATVKTTGDARIQFGSDWWNSVDGTKWTADCPKDIIDPDPLTYSACEGWVSNWYSSESFMEIRMPLN